MRCRGSGKRAGCPPGSLDGLLHVHSEIHNVQKRLHRVNGLIVAAWASSHQEEFPISGDERPLKSAARPLSGFERVGVTLDQGVIIPAAIQDKSKFAHDHLCAEPAVKTWCEADRVSLLIDNGDLARVSIMVAFTFYTIIARPVHGTEPGFKSFRRSGPEIERSPQRIDHLSTLDGVRLRE
jgi:hypothetical protein